MARRKTLAERNAAAMAASAAPVKTAAKKTTTRNPAATRGGGSIDAVTRPDGTPAFKVSISLPKDVWEDSRRAYVAALDDLQQPPTSHSEWIEFAIQDHLARGAQGRMQAEADLEAPQLGIVPRPIYLAEGVTDAIADQAGSEDRAIGNWRSRSAWIVGAMRVAIAEARERRGGELPIAPERLPRQSLKHRRSTR